MTKSVNLVTCVTNAGGIGPGHSAIAYNNTIYSFEDINYGKTGSAWIVIGLNAYIRKNSQRPVILQELTSTVNSRNVINYIQKSIANDDDFIGSGVCSSQAAAAIEAGYAGKFNTFGVDKPYEIYQLAKSKGIVKTETMHWAGQANCNWFVRTRIQGLLKLLRKGFSPAL
jgi:hypothetical protein